MLRLLRRFTVFIFLVAAGANLAQQTTVTFDAADWASILDEDNTDQADRWEFVGAGKENNRRETISSLPEKLSSPKPTISRDFLAVVAAAVQRERATTVLQL